MVIEREVTAPGVAPEPDPLPGNLPGDTLAILAALAQLDDAVKELTSRREEPAPNVFTFSRGSTVAGAAQSHRRAWSVRMRCVGFVFSSTNPVTAFVVQMGTISYRFTNGQSDAQTYFVPFPVTVDEGVDVSVFLDNVGTQMAANDRVYMIGYPDRT